jgi:hypothetical protein
MFSLDKGFWSNDNEIIRGKISVTGKEKFREEREEEYNKISQTKREVNKEEKESKIRNNEKFKK